MNGGRNLKREFWEIDLDDYKDVPLSATSMKGKKLGKTFSTNFEKLDPTDRQFSQIILDVPIH